MKNLAIVGIGYWGKKLISEFSKIANIKFCYSQGNISNINWLHRNYPKIKFCKKKRKKTRKVLQDVFCDF